MHDVSSDALSIEAAALRRLARARGRELRTVRRLAQAVLRQRSDVETFLVAALQQVFRRKCAGKFNTMFGTNTVPWCQQLSAPCIACLEPLDCCNKDCCSKINRTSELSNTVNKSRALHGDLAGVHAAFRKMPGRGQVYEERLKEDGGSGVQLLHEQADQGLQDLGKVNVKVRAFPA